MFAAVGMHRHTPTREQLRASITYGITDEPPKTNIFYRNSLTVLNIGRPLMNQETVGLGIPDARQSNCADSSSGMLTSSGGPFCLQYGAAKTTHVSTVKFIIHSVFLILSLYGGLLAIGWQVAASVCRPMANRQPLDFRLKKLEIIRCIVP